MIVSVLNGSNEMIVFILYGISLFLLLLSFIKDKSKTKKAVIRAAKSLENIMPQFLGIVLIVGIMLAALKPETISSIIGNKSGVLGVFISALVGSIAMMPTFVAFSTANMLLENGAGFAQVGALVSTLTLIGIVTIPLEAKYIGKKAAFLRNILAFFFSLLVGFVVGQVMVRL